MVKAAYEKFIGKICTILTGPVSFPFSNPKQHAEFFTGLIVAIEPSGILIKHLNTNTHAFYAFPIVGIVEEQVVSKTDPNFNKIKEEVEQKKKPASIVQQPTSQVSLSVEDLTKMAKQIKDRKK